MSDFSSALYRGAVTHRRVRPRAHYLRYSIFNILLDLDELPSLHRQLRLFSLNRFNLFSFHERDHGDGSRTGLRKQIELHLEHAGIKQPGAIRVLCMPRILGYVFNPLSIFFCHTRDGSLNAILYEVNNTFGERHSYLIPASQDQTGEVTQSCDKCFHVSPFMDIAMRYAFRVSPPADNVAVAVDGSDTDGLMIATVFSGQRQPLSDGSLFKAFFSYPLLTLKVVIGIHWEALKLWRKGIGLRPHPAAPHEGITIVRGSKF
jgi:DUF1365 family protein